MKKKYLVSFIIALCLTFSFSICFANDGLETAANDVRNFVGGVENTVENAARDVSNVSKDATGSLENDMSNKQNNSGRSSSTNTNNYSAVRTSTSDNTLMGMTSTAWTWLIIGIAAIAIIAVVWYYSMQFNNTNRHHDDD